MEVYIRGKKAQEGLRQCAAAFPSSDIKINSIREGKNNYRVSADPQIMGPFRESDMEILGRN